MRGDGVGSKVVLGDFCQGFSHFLVFCHEFINCLFDCGDKALLAVAGHFCMHAVTFASTDMGEKSENNTLLVTASNTT